MIIITISAKRSGRGGGGYGLGFIKYKLDEGVLARLHKELRRVGAAGCLLGLGRRVVPLLLRRDLCWILHHENKKWPKIAIFREFSKISKMFCQKFREAFQPAEEEFQISRLSRSQEKWHKEKERG